MAQRGYGVSTPFLPSLRIAGTTGRCGTSAGVHRGRTLRRPVLTEPLGYGAPNESTRFASTRAISATSIASTSTPIRSIWQPALRIGPVGYGTYSAERACGSLSATLLPSLAFASARMGDILPLPVLAMDRGCHLLPHRRAPLVQRATTRPSAFGIWLPVVASRKCGVTPPRSTRWTLAATATCSYPAAQIAPSDAGTSRAPEAHGGTRLMAVSA